MGFVSSRINFSYTSNTTASTSITDSSCLMYTLVNDMIGNGFTLVGSDTSTGTGSSAAFSNTSKTKIVILKPTDAVDPLIATDPWVVVISLKDGSKSPSFSGMVGGTPVTTAAIATGAKVNGTVPFQLFPYSGISIAVLSMSLTESVPLVTSPKVTGATYYDILPALTNNINDSTPRINPTHPYGYIITIVKRGFALAIYDQTSTETIYLMGVAVVQRAMGCSNTMISTGETPLYFLTNINPYNGKNGVPGIDFMPGPTNSWFCQIVREKDVLDSYPPFAQPSPDNSYVEAGNNKSYQLFETSISDTSGVLGTTLNRFPSQWNAPVTSDTGEYIMVFPFSSCSNRFAYNDELDLIAVSKADAYQSSQLIPLTVFNDSRKYYALSSNNSQMSNNGGIRVFILFASSEISAS